MNHQSRARTSHNTRFIKSLLLAVASIPVIILAFGMIKGELASASETDGKRQATQALHAEASVLLEQGDFTASAALLERALRINPGDPELWHTLGQVHYENRNFEQAEAAALRSQDLVVDESDLWERNELLIAQTRIRSGQAPLLAENDEYDFYLLDTEVATPIDSQAAEVKEPSLSQAVAPSPVPAIPETPLVSAQAPEHDSSKVLPSGDYRETPKTVVNTAPIDDSQRPWTSSPYSQPELNDWSARVDSLRLTAQIPSGHLPPPGECRIWYPNRPAGHQPPPGNCDALAYNLSADSFLVRGD